jgi:hypothetical protein
MATWAEMRTDFLGRMIHDDITVAEADTYLNKSIQRCQRELRIPCMDRIFQTTVAGASLGTVAIPSDFLEMQDIFVDLSDGRSPALTKLSLRQLKAKDPLACPEPEWYARDGAYWRFVPWIPIGRLIDIRYFGEFSAFATDASENELSAIADDLIVWGAMADAGDFYRHPQTDEWEDKFVRRREGLSLQGRDMENSGGPMEVQATASF